MKALKNIATYTAATLTAIAILTFSTEDERRKQVAQAKRNIAERKAQMEARKAELEAELKQLKADLKEVQKAEAALEEIEQPVAEPEPTTPEPVTEPENEPQPEPQQPEEEVTEFSLEAKYLTFTIRELKAIASQKKLKGYGKMKKAELAKALADLG